MGLIFFIKLLLIFIGTFLLVVDGIKILKIKVCFLDLLYLIFLVGFGCVVTVDFLPLLIGYVSFLCIGSFFVIFLTGGIF